MMRILTTPNDIDAQTLTLVLQRTHQAHLGMRIGTAISSAIIAYFAMGQSNAFPIVIWLFVTVLSEYMFTRQVRQQEIDLHNPTPEITRRITRSLFHMAAFFTVIYSFLGALLAFSPMPGPLYAALLTTIILMNIAGQHVLHKNMFFWSILAPAFTLIVAGYQLGGMSLVIVGVILLQAFSLTRAAVDSYSALSAAITEAKSQSAARIEADAANSAKSLFLANMSHELRTPLNAIIGYSEIMREDAEAAQRNSDIKDHTIVLDSAQRLLRLINDVLDVAKIESGNMVCEAIDFDIKQEVLNASDTIRPSLSGNGNHLILDLDPHLPVIKGDAFKFGQCVLNLLSNASKFTNQGTITLKSWQGWGASKGQIFVSVSDTGIGMTDAQIASLFQSFNQADESITRKFGGTGLGLSLSRSLARLMGGDIIVTSTLGNGSCFTLSIAPVAIHEVERIGLSPAMPDATLEASIDRHAA